LYTAGGFWFLVSFGQVFSLGLGSSWFWISRIVFALFRVPGSVCFAVFRFALLQRKSHLSQLVAVELCVRSFLAHLIVHLQCYPRPSDVSWFV
jgi:hypothetical protein